MAKQKYTPTKLKGPNKLVTMGLVVVFLLVVFEEWPRIRDFVASVSGMYGGEVGILDGEFRRVSAIGKTAVARYWVSNGRPPTSNLQAGLEVAESYKGGMLVKMEVIDGGVLEFQFNGDSGVANGIVTLLPDSSQVMQNVIKWTCTTRSYPHLTDCQYRPPGG